MTDINYHPDMNGNVPNQFIERVSQEVKEVPNNAVGHPRQQINRLIAFYDNQQNVIFGQSEPYSADGQGFVNSRHLMKIIKWLGIGVLLLLIFLAGVFLAPSLDIEYMSAQETLISVTLAGAHIELIIKEENSCFCESGIVEANLDVDIIAPVIYNEPNVANLFKETSVLEFGDDSTCALYDIFLYVFTKLCCLKDNIIGIIPTEPHTDINSTYESDEKAGQTSLTTDNLFPSKIEQNDVVSTEDIRPTNKQILEETNEEIIEKHAT